MIGITTEYAKINRVIVELDEIEIRKALIAYAREKVKSINSFGDIEFEWFESTPDKDSEFDTRLCVKIVWSAESDRIIDSRHGLTI